MSLPAPIQSIAIVGGGTAGWSAAALLSKVLGPGITITLIETSDIPTVGVGEATIPPIFDYLRLAGIDELDFIRNCQATFKLGIEFRDWHHLGHRYWHPFGNLGLTIDQRPFHHFWWASQRAGEPLDIADFCPPIALAQDHKFAFPPRDGSYPGGAVGFALHFDAGLVAAYLRRHAEKAGVIRLDRRIKGASVGPGDRIEALTFDDGAQLSADLYIDCSGFRGLLISEALGVGYRDWSAWLPCDRAVAVPSAHVPDRTPYTVSKAQEAGWQWRIALQGRVGNGYVYSSQFTDDDKAAAVLLDTLDAEPLATPRVLRFTPGHRERSWAGNCVAIGLAAGFLEPLESTSIHLIHTGLNRLLDYFPDTGFAPALAEAYNREVADEYAHIRDFLLLHYYPNARHGEPFWDYMRCAPLPESLTRKMELYTAAGRIVSRRRELFADISWFFVASGMGLVPDTIDPLVANAPPDELRRIFGQIRDAVRAYRGAATKHDAILERVLDVNERHRPNFAAGGAWAR